MKENNNFKPEILIFDLDNTLYSKDSKLMQEISKRIGYYIRDSYKVSNAEADKIRKKYLGEYGSSVYGLVHVDGKDPNEYNKYVYNIDYPSFISKNLKLIDLLTNLPQPKFIFTSGSKCHAGRVLDILGVKSFFQSIISIEDTKYYSKPLDQSYEHMLKLTGIDAHNACFFDDHEANLAGAKKFGIKTVLVGSYSQDFKSVKEITDLQYRDFI